MRAEVVPSGLACGCSCPACGARLVARRGEARIAHFAHDAERACAGAHETTLHQLAKQLIADGALLTLPEVIAEHEGRRRSIRPLTTVRPETVALERTLGGVRPDVLATVAGRPLLIELAVTHFCGPEKIALIRERRLAAIEIDLSRIARDASPDLIEVAILHSAPRRWLWNRLAEAAEADMRAEAAEGAARRARAREEALERVGRELARAASASPRHPGTGRLAWAVNAVQRAGLAGAVGVAVEGDGCFAVAREVWQSHLIERLVLGGIPFDEHDPLASLRPLLRRPFAKPTPSGFGWSAITSHFPNVRPPTDVVADYVRHLGIMGLATRGPNGRWTASRAARIARNKHQASLARGRKVEA